MKASACAALFLVGLSGNARPSAAATLFASRSSTGSPVERVVKLLDEMKGKLEMDEKSEQQTYDKYACWCEKTTARKAGAITDASSELRTLGQNILSDKGFVATRASEISELEVSIRENEESQAQATTLREKENGAYTATTVELKQAIGALEKAVTVLVKATSPATFLQEATREQLRALVGGLPVTASIKPEQVSMLSTFLKVGADAKYTPQSGTVQGILQDMYQTMTSDLESMTQAEANSNMNFEKFIADRSAQLKAAQEEKAQKEGEKAEAELRLAAAQEAYDATSLAKQADEKFFDETKKACSEKHDAWTERSSMRTEELAGISEALKILTSDDARKLFASAIKPGKETGAEAPVFLQVRSGGSPVDRAYAALKRSATAGGSLRLAALAARVRTTKVGHFVKVLMAIEKTIQDLKKEEQSDIQKRDQCKSEYQENTRKVNELDWKVEKNEAKIDKVTQAIQAAGEELAQTIEQINDVEAHMGAITAERTADNQAFLQAKLEDQQAIDLLTSAREALAKFSKDNKIDMGEIQGSVKGVFAQQGPEFAVSADQAPDADFSDKGHRQGENKGIVSILTMIIEDLGDEIKNGMKVEAEAHLSFEDQMRTANQLKDDLVNKKLALETTIAERTQAKADEIMDKEANEQTRTSEHDYKKSITPDCDWIIGAFSKRADARKLEMDGLVGARDLLSGMAASPQNALLETKAAAAFDDTALSKVRFLGMRS